ncbi:major facilitator superfamily [Heterobasidion irregulare TC 32-1]|uniref:Major facilitator superfamily n=1 Tax=Heterobasidion irregulare (strain TC 32-1) TaxID=747525 RepID=W4K661_HETIT|nr:major facilitator superfamily [Heterobasidion irregulare TC 32-1]ETW81273.1 major facilitator superfamily [Heterobasidion irregulare TC 32-1]
MTKIDLMIIPLVGVIYFLSFLDRANIGNARIAGLQKDLNMTDHQFSVSLTVFYVSYILTEVPVNLVLKRFGANITIPLMVVLWGLFCACQGSVTTFGGLIACRFFLGMAEGGLFPSLVLYLSNFYPRHSLQLRLSMTFSVTSLAGAFSGLLAAAIEDMDGLRGLSGWAWIFVLEGVLTVLCGILSFFLLPREPSKLRWLTRHEKAVYVEMLREDWSGDAEDEKFSWAEVWSVFLNAPHFIILCVHFFVGGITLFGLATFTPTIVNALSFSTTRSQLLTVPPFACSFVTSLVSAYLSDKYKRRGVTALVFSFLAILGYAIFIGTPNKHANYGALFLQIIGVYGLAPCTATWNANNVQPHFRRATAIAFASACTNVGGIVSTWIFIDPPRFHTASAVNVSFATGNVLACGGLIVYLVRRNAAKRAHVAVLLREKGDGTEKGGWDSPEERQRLGDRHPRFVYTL